MAEGLVARQAALALLMGVMSEGQPLSDLLAAQGPMALLTPADRARAQRLAVQVLRQVEPVDRLLQPSLRKAPPLEVMNILRLAVTELNDSAAAHGVINSAVEIAKRGKHTGSFGGLVNAVLRAVPAGAALAGLPQRLPRWLRQPMVHAYDREAVAAIEAVQAKAPPIDLTVHGNLRPEGVLLPSGSLRLTDPGQVSTLPGYAEGHWWVQDAAAALAVPMLGDLRGQRVLDLCAAPGGKTLQLAAGGADVTALDISGPRMARVAENLARTGLAARLVTADALHWQPDALFDAVLLDAPCSASGTIRRHPDLPFVKDGSEIAALVVLQAQLFDRALTFLKPGGRLVYVTCSLLPEEGEAQLTAALVRHPDLQVVRTELAGVPAEWLTPDGGLRLRPDYWADLGGMDGFFMACVTR
ncbi:MAG: transcription antitermination factor NusB [Paracoccaceae bacterium]